MKNQIFAWADINIIDDIHDKDDQDFILYTFLNFYGVFWSYISHEWLCEANHI